MHDPLPKFVTDIRSEHLMLPVSASEMLAPKFCCRGMHNARSRTAAHAPKRHFHL